jgi:hypothetical protein
MNIYTYIYRERELGYGVTQSINGPCATHRFSNFKVQMVKIFFHMKIKFSTSPFLIFQKSAQKIIVIYLMFVYHF